MQDSRKSDGISGTDGTGACDLGDLIARIGWSGAELGRRVEATPSTVYNWLNGIHRTPGAVIAYLNLIITFRETLKSMGELDERFKDQGRLSP